MFERYTDRSRRAIALAQDEARRLGHTVLDVDHLLLGLAAEGEGAAAQALGQAREGLGAVCVRAALLRGRPQGRAHAGHVPFARGVKRVIDQALRESLKLGHNYTGTEHLLLGVAWDCEAYPDSPCAAVLAACAVTPGEVREAVMELLRGYGDVPPPAADDDERMAAVAAELAEIGRRLRRVHELLGIPA